MSTNIDRHFDIVQLFSCNHNNQIFPDQLKSISIIIKETSTSHSTINSLTDTYETKKQDRRRICGRFPWFKLCCYFPPCLVLLLLGLIAILVPVLLSNHSRTATSIATTTTASTTITTTPSTAPVTITTVSTSSTTVTTTTTTIIFPSNWVANGDGETGPCESGAGVTHPTGWMYNGTMTQVYYNNTSADQKFTDPGPSDRGKCYFYGQNSAVTSMWQTVNMTSSINSVLIDNQTVWFNFSAWIGGYLNQNDNGQVLLMFLDQANLKVGSNFILGPVLAADRSSVTSLLLRQTNGLVPVNARSFRIVVTITRASGAYNDGDVDNIALYLYQ